jgi:hypothetical protein
VRTGASGMIGAEVAARANPDGYTFLIATSQHAIVNVMYEKRPYDLVRDFTPVTLIASTPFIMLVNPSVAAGSCTSAVTTSQPACDSVRFTWLPRNPDPPVMSTRAIDDVPELTGRSWPGGERTGGGLHHVIAACLLACPWVASICRTGSGER